MFKLTLLSPGPRQLAKLKPKWQEECRKAGLDPNVERPEQEEAEERPVSFAAGGDLQALADARTPRDSSVPNGASIALLAEYKKVRVLLAGDAHGDVITESIDRLTGGDKLQLTAFKLPHHGSRANVTVDLLKRIHCKRYLFSSNGRQFRHPDEEAVARAIVHGGESPELYFNYRSTFSERWENDKLQEKYGYRTIYPPRGTEGLVLDL